MTKRVHAVVSGRVQGVGFRAFVLRRARAQEPTGWVRNLMDTRQVELEVQGPDAAVDDLIDSVRTGPPSARVLGVSVENVPLERAGESGFHEH